MRRLVKYSLIAAAVLVVAALIGLWLLNRWVKSPETQAYLEREMSKQLKFPVKFKTLDFSIWNGLKAEGVTVPDRGGNFLVAEELTAKHRLGALLRGQIVLSEIKVDGATFRWMQRPDGSWKLPELPADLKEEKKTVKTPADKAAEPAAKTKKHADVSIEHIVLSNATADFLDSAGKPFASATGLRLNLVCDAAEEKIEGGLAVGRAVLHGYLAATEVSAGVHQSKEKGLFIENFTGKVGGGKLTGSYMRKADKDKSNFSTRLALTDVDLVAAAMDGDAPPPNLSGHMTAQVFLKGDNDEWKGAKGNGTVALQNGGFRKINEIEWLKEVGEFLQLDPTTVLTVPEGKLSAEFQMGTIFVKEMSLAAPPLMVTATGRAKWDGKMDLEARFRAEAGFVARRALLEPQFAPVEKDGFRSVAFSLKGNVSKPKTDLREKLTGTKDRKVQDFVLGEAVLDSIVDKMPITKPKEEDETPKAPKPPKKPKAPKTPPPPAAPEDP